MRVGKVWLDAEVLLGWLGYQKGVLLGVKMLDDRRVIEISLTDERMPLVKPGEILQVVEIGGEA